MKPCAGVFKENTNYNIKDPPHTRLNSYKGARLYDCAAVATSNSDTSILSLVNHLYQEKWTVVTKTIFVSQIYIVQFFTTTLLQV